MHFKFYTKLDSSQNIVNGVQSYRATPKSQHN